MATRRSWPTTCSASSTACRCGPGAWAERLLRWGRRNPVVAGLLALVVAVCLVGFAGVAWQWREARREARVARAAKGLAERREDEAAGALSARPWPSTPTGATPWPAPPTPP